MFRILLIATLSLTTGYKMGGLQDIFDSKSAAEERSIFGLTREQQGKPDDAQVKKANAAASKAVTKSLTTMDYVKGNEGFESKIYDDTKKLRTVGYGFNLEDETTRKLLHKDVISGKRDITREEADDVFQKRFAIAIDDAISYMGGKNNFSKLSDSQKQGLIDMSYNLGLSSLNGFNELRKALYTGNKLQAKAEVLNSKYAQSDVPNRALKNANLMLK